MHPIRIVLRIHRFSDALKYDVRIILQNSDHSGPGISKEIYDVRRECMRHPSFDPRLHSIKVSIELV